MEYSTLNNGHIMPALGLGTAHVVDLDPKAIECFMTAVDCGYRHFDTARTYGSEGQIGKALAAKLQDGSVTRKDLFITTKLLGNAEDPNSVHNNVAKSLRELQLTYINLYLIHWPVGIKDEGDTTYVDTVDYLDTYKALENEVDKGLIRSIGVSNFNSKQLQRIMDNCRIKPAVNQIEIHPYLSQQKLVKFCQDNNIHVTAYCPLGVSAVYAPQFGRFTENREKSPKEDPKVISIAKKHNKTPAQVLIRYAIERGVSVIPKTVNPGRMCENLQVFDFKLSTSDMEALYSLDRNGRILSMPFWRSAKYYPFAGEF